MIVFSMASRACVIMTLLGGIAGCGSDESGGPTMPLDDGGVHPPDGGSDASSAGAFDILGVTGPDDTTIDTWLVGTPTPIVNWKTAAGAEAYDVTVYEENGTTVKCPTQKQPGSATSAPFAGCALTDGVQYRAGVSATVGTTSTPASNDKLRFAVGAIVIGQPDAKTNNGVRIGLALPNDVVFVGSRLVVADQNNSRVLIWNTVPTANHQQADLVLGQPDFMTGSGSYGGVAAGNFQGSNGVASDGTRLVVGDRFNYRVLVWNTFPSRDFQPADVVLGQPDFTSNTSNNGGVSARSMTEPWVWIGGGKLFVSDRNNYRVLIWNTIPTQNRTPADVVLGQPDMTSGVANNGGLSASSFADPGRGWSDGTRLFVPDLGNHRVLVWNALPSSNNAPADLVLGQANMTSNQPNAGGATGAVGFNGPVSVYASGATVAVADYVNNRVALWTSPITASGQAADLFLGQANAAGNMVNAGGLSASSLNTPNAVAGDGTRLAVSDRFNHRVLLFPTVPATSGAPASIALGQPDLVSGRLANAGPVSASTFVAPTTVAQVGQRFAVADWGNDRVLLWNAPPASSGDLPNVVLGQNDFTSFGPFGGTASAGSFCGPWYVHSDGTRLLVGELCNRRVTIWSALPTSNRQPADLVLGQPDMTTFTQNTGGISASSMSNRPQPHIDGQRLYVAEPVNHRVLIWNALPTVNGKAADIVLGQPDMMSNTANNGGLGAQTFSSPTFAYTSGSKLFVADSNNHRVLIWNTLPTTTRAPADVVLGQPNMTSGTAVAPTARTLRSPVGVHVDANGRLYVVDSGNSRIVYWNAIPTQSQAAADGVIGQPNLDTGLANNGGLSSRTLQGPGSVVTSGDLVYVVDTGNSRLLAIPRP
jgi:NHL repeat